MRHASWFTGVGGFDLGFQRAGITTVSVSEIDSYASSVLAERFPDAPNLGDITEVNADEIPEANIWSGGFPCQDLSVAGKRAGFAGKRSSLAFTFLNLVERARPRWLVLENVPGLFSSNHGADFGRLLYEMEKLGYGVAWRIFDARYFGVPQRRRRLFIVGSFGSDRAAEILHECEGCNGHIAPSRPLAKDNTDKFTRRITGKPSDTNTQTYTNGDGEADGFPRRLDNKQRVDYKAEKVLTFPSRFGGNAKVTEDYAQSFAHSAGAPAVLIGANTQPGGNENLLPLGLDTHRYRCCGNGVVVPVAEWIGTRIVKTDKQWNERSST